MLYGLKPLKIFYIEDNKSFANTLKELMFEEYGLSIELLSPNNAEELISKLNLTDSDNRFNDKDLKEKLASRLISYKEILEYYSSIMPEEAVIAIFDHDLGAMKGLDLCKEIKSGLVGKIIFTGKANTTEIIDSLNNKVVDYYISKLDNQWHHTLYNTIKDLQIKLLTNILGPFISPLVSENHIQPLEALIQEIIVSKRIVEYYVIDPLGSCWLKDVDGNQYLLLLFNKDSASVQEEALEGLGVPLLISNEMIKEKKFLYLARGFDSSKWFNSLYDCTKVPGLRNYYYALSRLT
jgi:CheY-like chemotaxis protein